MPAADTTTAEAFSTSWNHIGSVYTREQFIDWMAPIDLGEIEGKDVLELGFGNGSLLAWMGTWKPRRLAGVELGDTIETTLRNLRHLPPGMAGLQRGDLTTASPGEFDLVYCIGVLHHLQDPERGFDAVLRNTKPGGRFHCWVYAKEGNGLIRLLVEPVRRVASKLPWWITKYAIALPLVVPYYLLAKLLRMIPSLTRKLPLGPYTLWIAPEPFRFFHHVAFDQLVTPQTAYLERSSIERWLQDPRVDPSSAYILQRNGNSWTFGGCRR
jgi:SAM-dependent methyltransferase